MNTSTSAIRERTGQILDYLGKKTKSGYETAKKHTGKTVGTGVLVAQSFLPTSTAQGQEIDFSELVGDTKPKTTQVAQDDGANKTKLTTTDSKPSSSINFSELVGKTRVENAKTPEKTYRAYSKNPLYQEYEDKVRALVDEALPKDIEVRKSFISVISNSTVDQVLRGPEDFSSKSAYFSYINGIYSRAVNAFGSDRDGMDKFGSMTTTASYVQGTMTDEGKAPDGDYVFTQAQLDRLFGNSDYNQSINAIGKARAGMHAGRTKEQLRALSDRIIDLYLPKDSSSGNYLSLNK